MTAWDLFDRALCPFVALKDTALQLKDGQTLHDLTQIDLGVLERHLTPNVSELFRMAEAQTIPSPRIDYLRQTDMDFSFLVGDVPVVVRVIKKQWGVFDHPDTVFYATEDFKIPNPFEKYYKIRSLVR